MAEERETLLEVKDLEVTYGSGKKAYRAVNRANFKIYKGETFGLVGESGSGKTTIGRAIMRILPTSGGEILYKGQKINGKISHALDQQVIKEIQMIFQDPQSSLNERAKVSYIVGEGLMNVRPDLTAAQREEKVRQALLDVGLLPEFASRFPHEFSGGQRQRIGIARALIVEPEFIIADEPISALDMSIRAQVLNLLRHLQKERGITYLFIAHDLSVMRRFGGAGTLVPITGFSNAVTSPALDFKSEGFVTGMAAKMFTVAGPVITFGTLASVIYGAILMLFR